MTQRIRIAVVGTGRMAARMTAALQHHPDFDVSAIISRDQGRAREFGSKFNVSTFGDIETTLSNDSIQAVYIATENETHASYVNESIKRGKGVLCEKPIAINYREAIQIQEEQNQSKKLVLEAIPLVFLPSVQTALSKARGLDCGNPLSFEASFGYPADTNLHSRILSAGPGGGVLLDRLVYPLSFSLNLFGSIAETTGYIRRNAEGVSTSLDLVSKHAQGGVSRIAVSLDGMLPNRGSICCSSGRIDILEPLLTSEQVTVIKASKNTVKLDQRSAKDYLMQYSVMRKLSKLLKPASLQLPYGRFLYDPMLTHFASLMRAGATDSPNLSLTISVEMQSIISSIQERTALEQEAFFHFSTNKAPHPKSINASRG
jgi:predicted dehydrogenase